MRVFLLYGFSAIFTFCANSYPDFARAESMPDQDAMGESINLQGVEQATTVSIKNGEVVLLAPGESAIPSKKFVSKKPKTEIAVKKENPKPAIAAARVVRPIKKEILVAAKPNSPPVIAVSPKPTYINPLRQFITAANNIALIIKPQNLAMKTSAGSLAKNISITPSAYDAFNKVGGFLNEKHNETFIIITRAPVVMAAANQAKPLILEPEAPIVAAAKPRHVAAPALVVTAQPKPIQFAAKKPQPPATSAKLLIPSVAVVKPVRISAPLVPPIITAQSKSIRLTTVIAAPSKSVTAVEKPKLSSPITIAVTKPVHIAAPSVPSIATAQSKPAHLTPVIITSPKPMLAIVKPKPSTPAETAAAKPVYIAAPPVPSILTVQSKAAHLTPVIISPPKPMLAVAKPKPSPPAVMVAAAKPVHVAAPPVPSIVTAQSKPAHLTPVIIAPPKPVVVLEKPKPSPPAVMVAAAKPVHVAAPPVPSIVTAQSKPLHLTPVIMTPPKPKLAVEKTKPSPPAVTIAAAKPVRIIAPPVPPIAATNQTKSVHLTPVIVVPPLSELAAEKPMPTITKPHVMTTAAKPSIDLTPVTLPANIFAVNILNHLQKTNTDLSLANAWRTEHPAYLLAELNYIAPPRPTAIILPEDTASRPTNAVIVHEVSDTAPAGGNDNENERNLSTTSQEIDYSALDETNEKGIVIEGATPSDTAAPPR